MEKRNAIKGFFTPRGVQHDTHRVFMQRSVTNMDSPRNWSMYYKKKTFLQKPARTREGHGVILKKSGGIKATSKATIANQDNGRDDGDQEKEEQEDIVPTMPF